MSNAPNVAQSFAPSDRTSGTSLNRGQKLAAAGGIIGALVASSCCILPVTLFSLGIGDWLVYRSSTAACAEDEACARPLPNRIVKIALIMATVIVLAAWTFDYVAPYVLS